MKSLHVAARWVSVWQVLLCASNQNSSIVECWSLRKEGLPVNNIFQQISPVGEFLHQVLLRMVSVEMEGRFSAPSSHPEDHPERHVYFTGGLSPSVCLLGNNLLVSRKGFVTLTQSKAFCVFCPPTALV